MKRRHAPRRLPPSVPGESWSQWVRRIIPPKVIRAAEERLDREQLLWRWPAVVRVKSEYDRRRRTRTRRNR